MRKALPFALAIAGLLLASVPALAQVTAANYAFATSTAGSLTDMSTGTTTLVGASSDDTQSSVVNIGFDFYFKSVRFSQFSATSNGLLNLGTSTGFNATYSMASAVSTWLGPCVSDQRTTASGKVHYKVLGAAPNRVLVVEWLNMYSYFSATGETADYTYQARLYETTGAIEFVYGGMTMSTAGAGSAGSQSPQIGFSWGNSAGSVGAVTAPQAGSPTYDGTTGAVVDNLYVAGAITVLTSAADGSRRTILLTPPVPTAPTALNFTGVGKTGMTVNWTDAPDEQSYAVYRSTDGVNYSYAATLPAGGTAYGATGLAPGTTYHWRVYSVSEGGLSTALSGSQATTASDNVLSTGSGLWSAPATWSTNAIPTDGDNVTIADGHTVTIDTAAAAWTLTVGQGTSGVLEFESAAARTLTVGTDVTVALGGTFRSNAAGTVTTHLLSLAGNLTNNGTLDFSTNGNTAGASITFTGAQNATFSGSGATTNVRGITVNKGTTPASILELSTSAFSVQGSTTDTVTGGWLVMTNGTLKLSGTFTGTSRVFSSAAYTIPVSFGFWLNNPNYTVAGQNASPTLNGLLRITQGTFNVGTATGNSMGFSAGSTVIVEGGAVNAAGRFGVAASTNAFSYSQSGGTVTVCTQGNASTTLACFDVGTSLSSSIAISGGTIVVQLASTAASGPRDYRHQAGNGFAGVTGGTLQLGNAASGAAKAFTLRGILPNLVVTNTSANHSASMDTTLANYNNLAAGTVTISPGTTFNTNNVIFLMAGPSMTNDGTLTSTGASSRFYWFDGGAGAPQTYTGSGVVTAPMTSFEFGNVGGLTITSANQVITSRVILFAGSVTGAAKITLGNGGATTGTVQIGNTTTPTAAGTFDAPLTFNLGTGGQNVSYLRTTLARTTGGEVNPARALTNFTYDDNDATHSLTISGGDLSAAGTVTLTNGKVVTGANTFSVGGAGTVARTNGYVVGNLRKSFTAAASKAFEVGTANGYSPVVFNATAGTFPADVTVAAVQATAPNILPADKAITRYWTLTATGLTADLTFTYLDPADIPATVTESLLHVYRRDAGLGYTDLTGTIDTTANTGAVTGVTTFSDWTLAEAGATPVELMGFTAE